MNPDLYDWGGLALNFYCKGKAIVPEEDAFLCCLPWHSLKVIAPIILSVTAIFPV